MSGEPRFEAVVIGASAGGLDALSQVLPELPADYALPVMVVMHLPADRNSLLAELLAAKCKVGVREAEDKEPLSAGMVYFAPPDYHLLVESDGRLSLSSDEPVHHSRPAIDVLFESAAEVYGAALIGVVLTGANEDGAAGLRSIEDRGGLALVQEPATAQALEMPRAALQACATARALSLREIATMLLESAPTK